MKALVPYHPHSGQDPELMQMQADTYGYKIVFPRKDPTDAAKRFPEAPPAFTVLGCSLMAAGVALWLRHRSHITLLALLCLSLLPRGNAQTYSWAQTGIAGPPGDPYTYDTYGAVTANYDAMTGKWSIKVTGTWFQYTSPSSKTQINRNVDVTLNSGGHTFSPDYTSSTNSTITYEYGNVGDTTALVKPYPFTSTLGTLNLTRVVTTQVRATNPLPMRAAVNIDYKDSNGQWNTINQVWLDPGQSTPIAVDLPQGTQIRVYAQVPNAQITNAGTSSEALASGSGNVTLDLGSMTVTSNYDGGTITPTLPAASSTPGTHIVNNYYNSNNNPGALISSNVAPGSTTTSSMASSTGSTSSATTGDIAKLDVDVVTAFNQQVAAMNMVAGATMSMAHSLGDGTALNVTVTNPTATDMTATNSKLDTLHTDNGTTQGKLDQLHTDLTDAGTLPTYSSINPAQTANFAPLHSDISGAPAKLPTAPTVGSITPASSIHIGFVVPKKDGTTLVTVDKTIDFSSSPYSTPIAIFRGLMLALVTLIYFFFSFNTVRGAFAGK